MHQARLPLRLGPVIVALILSTHGRAVAAPEAPDSLGVIGFGGSALILDDQVLIGRPGILVGFPMPAIHAGSVHVFGREGAGWVESAML